MKTSRISDKTQYEDVMKKIEELLQKVTESGGIDKLSEKEVKKL